MLSKTMERAIEIAGENDEELKACYSRIATLESTLTECREYFEERADADCDQDGFIPNMEMKIMVEIDEVMHGPGAF